MEARQKVWRRSRIRRAATAALTKPAFSWKERATIVLNSQGNSTNGQILNARRFRRWAAVNIATPMSASVKSR
jgi:hypothetical protein